MLVILFKDNFAFQHHGHCVTCRLGDKYSGLHPGDKILLQNLDNKDETAEAVVKALFYGALKYLYDEWVQCEHDPSLRSKEAIAKALSGWYNTEVTQESEITAIVYEITDWGSLARYIQQVIDIENADIVS